MKEHGQLNPWELWSHEVQRHIQSQQRRIEQLERQMTELGSKFAALEAKPTYNIESLEYHFDQLKVDTLEGTLNIGMTPAMGGNDAEGDVDQFTVGGPISFPTASSTMPAPGPPDSVINGIQGTLNDYLDTDAYRKLSRSGQDYNMTLDPYHQRIIIEDIRKQLPARIKFYLEQMKKSGKNAAAQYSEAAIEQVLEKTKRDADSALHAYLQNLKAGSLDPEGEQ